jgi:hypothetical protein
LVGLDLAGPNMRLEGKEVWADWRVKASARTIWPAIKNIRRLIKFRLLLLRVIGQSPLPNSARRRADEPR